MRTYIVYLLLIAVLGIIVSASIAQQNQTVLKTDMEIEALKIQLQTVENEKIALETKLAEANAKLINADFGKFERELKESNQQWLWGWARFLGVMFAVFGLALWLVVKSIIADRVEKSLNGFKESVEKICLLEGQLKVLKKEHAVSVLDNFDPHYPVGLEEHNEAIKALSEELLLDVFSDKTRDSEIRWKAADILVTRKSKRLVTPMLESLYLMANSDIDIEKFLYRIGEPNQYSDWLSVNCNKETYQELKHLLNRLREENPKNKVFIQYWTVYSLAYIGNELEINGSADIPIEVFSELKDLDNELSTEFGIGSEELIEIAEYFDKSKTPEGIKEIYNIHAKGKLPTLEEKCLELLEEYDPDFVKEQREEKETTNTESEDDE